MTRTKNIWISFDVECTGPVPSLHAMVDLGMVAIAERADAEGVRSFEMITSFQVLIAPPEDTSWYPATKEWWEKPEQAKAYETVFAPEFQISAPLAMDGAVRWLRGLKKLFPDVPHVFAAYPAAFDWPFLNHYMHRYCGEGWNALYPEGPGVMQRVACFDMASLGMHIVGSDYHDVSSGRMAKTIGAQIPPNNFPHTAMADAIEQGHLLVALLDGRKKERTMSIERTLAIIKPDAVRQGAVGRILAEAEAGGLHPKAIAMHQRLLSLTFWRTFYQEHEGRPFFDSLCAFMNSGPCVFIELEGPHAISRWRVMMGATDPADAVRGSIRARWGTEMPRNAVHGSDSTESFLRERGLLRRVTRTRP